jgi:S-adenosylmethionine:tRNA ribosyltransferase-isomerase
VQFDRPPLEVFNSIGHVPLPPYIKRPDEDLDKDRYATVYEDKNYKTLLLHQQLDFILMMTY